MTTRSDSYYDFEINPLNSEGCTVSLVRKPAEKEIVHTPEEYNYPDSLYQDHWEGAEAYGIVSETGEMTACIEVCPEEWSNRLLVTELWVSDVLRGKGIGKRLMDKAKEIALQQERRAVILETQGSQDRSRILLSQRRAQKIGRQTGVRQYRRRCLWDWDCAAEQCLLKRITENGRPSRQKPSMN
nr:GNAT family N-acetyltransferase [Lachnospiraceae bacterium]